MFYVGSKTRIADEVATQILDHTNNRKIYIEPFCGSCAVAKILAPQFDRVVLSDVHEDVVLMWHAAVYEGWRPGPPIDKDTYFGYKASPPSPDRAFYGFSCSFGSRWFDVFADHDGRRVMASAKSVMRNLENLKGAEFYHRDYRKFTPEPGSVAYCDPPYLKTTSNGSWPKFYPMNFWERMNSWSDSGVDVFVSEFEKGVPSSWNSVKITSRRSSQGPSGRPEVLEYLAFRG